LGIETIAYLGISAVYLLLRYRNNQKQKLIDQGVTDNGKEGDQGLNFKLNLGKIGEPQFTIARQQLATFGLFHLLKQ